MDEVGRRFECEEYFVPELLLSARAMKGSMEIVRPLLAARGAEPVGRVVIGTVKGDLHDIGKNLVASMLEGGGFEVIDLGADVPPERFIEAAAHQQRQPGGLSALLTVTMPSMKTTIDALRAAGVREKVKVMVGGAPVTQQYADEIGADGYGESAGAAVALARRLVAVVSRLREWLAGGLLITDGAWGTELQARGLAARRVAGHLESDPSRARGSSGARLRGGGQPGHPHQHVPRQRESRWRATWRRSIARASPSRTGGGGDGAGVRLDRPDGQDAAWRARSAPSRRARPLPRRPRRSPAAARTRC